jgi:hypothetical protein
MSQHQPGWWDDCFLWGQLNIQEHDPAHINIEWWKDFWRRTHIDGVTLNAGGIIHYYPTAQPLNWISPWLGNRDLFGELVQAARELGLKVLARFTPSRVHEEFAARHPDWCLTDSNGQPMPDPGHDPGSSGQMYHVCLNGPYYRWWIPEVMFREVMERYDVDGFFFNAWQNAATTLGPCHCIACRKGFAAATGLEMPTKREWSDPAWQAWLDWHSECCLSLAQQWQNAAKALKPSATAVLNLGHGLEPVNMSGRRYKALCAAHDMIDADHQTRHQGDPPWIFAATGKLMRSLVDSAEGGSAPGRSKPYYHLFGAYGGTGRIASQPPAEHTLIMAEAAASGSRLWYHVIGASGEDRRCFEAIERFFDFYHRHREFYRDTESCAEIAVAYSQRIYDIYGQDQSSRLVTEPFRGVYHALVRARLPFDMIHVDDLDDDALRRFRVLVLPNQACLSNAQCEAVRKFVQAGGALVATFETSRFDENGKRRDDFALADIFGVSSAADFPHGPIRNAYARLEAREELGSGFNGTNVLPLPEMHFCPVSLLEGSSAALTLIPPIPHMPPERAFFRAARTDTPLAVIRSHGKGRVAYFPFDIDRICASANSPDHRRLLENAVRWALKEPPSVFIEGPGIVDVHVYRQWEEAEKAPARVLIHMVNCTTPDLWLPPAAEIAPVGEQRLTVHLGKLLEAASSRRVRRARLLWRGEEARFEGDGDIVRVAIPSIEAYEILALEVA